MTYIDFFDKNMLYAGILRDYTFPQKDFKFLKEKDFHEFCKNFFFDKAWQKWTNDSYFTEEKIDKNGKIEQIFFGCMVEVDIYLPEEYHTHLIDSFPCLVSKKLIKFSDLSKHQVKIAKALNNRQQKAVWDSGSLALLIKMSVRCIFFTLRCVQGSGPKGTMSCKTHGEILIGCGAWRPEAKSQRLYARSWRPDLEA